MNAINKKFRQTPLRLVGRPSGAITRLRLEPSGVTVHAEEPPVLLQAQGAGLILVGNYLHETPDQRKAKRDAARQIREAPPPPRPTRRNAPLVNPKDQGYNKIVPRQFEGRVAVIFATGPSLTEEVVETIRPYHEDGTVVAFGCNDAYRIVPYLDVHYACDPPWWKLHVDHESIMEHRAIKWTQDAGAAQQYGVNLVKGTSGNGFSKSQELIHFGGNSGYQVINLALLYGCSRFLLVGYNMGVPPGKQHHFFGQHPSPLSRGTSFGSFVSSYSTIQPDIKRRIVNCTPESALKCFAAGGLKEVLEECRSLLGSPADPQP